MCSSYTLKFPCGHTHTEKQFCKRARRQTVLVRQKSSNQERGRSKTALSSSSSTPPSPQVQPSQSPPPSTPPPLPSSGSSPPSSPATPDPHQRASRSRSPSDTNRDHRSRSPLRPHRGLWPKLAHPSPRPQPATPKKRTTLPTAPEPKPKVPTKVRRHRTLFPCRNVHHFVNDDATNVCFLPGCRYEELGRLWACCRCERQGREVVGNRGERCRGTKGNGEIRCEHEVCEECWGFGEFFFSSGWGRVANLGLEMPSVPVFDKEVGGWK